jgi:serine/threonine protein kinase
MAIKASEFLDLLESSGLVSGRDVQGLRAKLKQGDFDAQTVASLLVREAKLTTYQANQLLKRKWRGFFIGNYKVLEPLGKGGMGIVFRAEHTILGRTVALKFLPMKVSNDPDSIARFHREARAIALLDHESIVRVYEVGDQGTAHYIVMEFVPGEKLSKLIAKRGRLAAVDAARVISQTAHGLAHAFERGVIHRDIKPSNLLITPQDRVKILDMGLARLFGEGSSETAGQISLTQTGAIVGTVDYVAPEQAKDSRFADIRSDIYSLGCTFYQCLTGQVPFPRGTIIERLLAHREDEPAPIASLAADVPVGLIQIVRQMMAKRPEDRFQRPAEVAGALLPYLEPAATLRSARPEKSTASRDRIRREHGQGLSEPMVSLESGGSATGTSPPAPTGSGHAPGSTESSVASEEINIDEFLQALTAGSPPVSKSAAEPRAQTLKAESDLGKLAQPPVLRRPPSATPASVWPVSKLLSKHLLQWPILSYVVVCLFGAIMGFFLACVYSGRHAPAAPTGLESIPDDGVNKGKTKWMDSEAAGSPDQRKVHGATVAGTDVS